MSFSSLRKFFNFEGDEQLNSIIASLSCVVIKAQLATNDEIGPLVDFVRGFKIQRRHLVIEVPTIHNSTVLQTQIINYNTMIYHDGKFMQLFLNSKHFVRNFSSQVDKSHHSALHWERDMHRYMKALVQSICNSRLIKCSQYFSLEQSPISSTQKILVN